MQGDLIRATMQIVEEATYPKNVQAAAFMLFGQKADRLNPRLMEFAERVSDLLKIRSGQIDFSGMREAASKVAKAIREEESEDKAAGILLSESVQLVMDTYFRAYMHGVQDIVGEHIGNMDVFED